MEQSITRQIKTIDEFNYDLLKSIPFQELKRGYKRKKKYLDVITAFDIETTNIPNTKQAIMYIWMFQICGHTIIGRSWDEFKQLLINIDEYIPDDAVIVVWVHNLSFEFQFLKSQIKIDSIMAMDERKVLQFTSGKFEFRCSYLHSNMSLEKYLESQNVEHKKTTLDYSKIRYPWTELNDDELEYCIHDVLGLVEAIEHEMKMDNDDLTTIPMTSTGYVRRKAKKVLGKYKSLIKSWLPDLEIMLALRRCFRGGNTHSNLFNTGVIIKGDIWSWDMSSAYPSVLLMYPYPTGFIQGVPEYFPIYLKHKKAILMDVILKNVKLKEFDYGCPYIPIAKCEYVVNGDNDNGRVRKADELKITINEIDYMILSNQYEFEMTITEIWHSPKRMLPKEFRDLILEEFRLKTELKGVDDYFYSKAKCRLNSLYGMCVQNPMRFDYVYEDGWISVEHFKDNDDLIEEYQKHGWIPYQWGVWCCSYARMRLEMGMMGVKNEDFIYCDTDSIKVQGDYADIFEKINEELKDENYYAIDSYGNKHYMGLYELENKQDKKTGKYFPIKKFKTLGAKKYCYEDVDGLHLTLAGVSKSGAKELKKIENFKEGFIFKESAGNEVYYNDLVDEHITIDGHDVHITSNACIQESTYELNLTMDYKRLIYALSKIDLNRDLYLDIQPSIIIDEE